MSMTQVIPNTDNLEVAKLAAVVYLFELGKTAQELMSMKPEKREEELRELYALLSQLASTSAGGWSR